jgi:ABC-2 type transport system ATP-binding protein
MTDPRTAPAFPPAVRAADLSVVRGGRTVLSGLTFEVPAGTVVGLLGPSGCGKTTLMRVLVQARVSGTCEVLGLPAGSAALRAHVGYVTQEPAVYGDLSVVENLRYFATVVGAPAGDVARVVDETDLGELVDRRVRTLSGGQVGRVSLASALLGSPHLLVLDEPTVGLDPVLRRDLWALFGRLAAAGVTLVVSSHVMDEASRCDRILLLRDGELLADDTEAGVIARTGAADVEGAFLTLVEGASA